MIKGVGLEMLPTGPYPIHFLMLSPKMMSVLVHKQALGKPAHFYGPKKRYFLPFFAVFVVLDHFYNKNRPIDLVRGLF